MVSYLLCWTWCTRCSIFLFTLFLILFLFVLFHFSLKSKIIHYKNSGENNEDSFHFFCNIINIQWTTRTTFKSNNKTCWLIKLFFSWVKYEWKFFNCHFDKTVCKTENSNLCKDRWIPQLQYKNPFNPGNLWEKDTK